MSSTNFVNGVTLTDAQWFDDVDGVAYGFATGVAGTNTITATGPAGRSAYAVGQRTWLVPAVTNTSATTLNLTCDSVALGARNVFCNGAACTGGELVANVPVELYDDGTRLQVVGTGVLVTLATIQELTNKTLNASVGKGTWTASGTWTLPAHTLGGTVSGGGQQLNNIIIGTVTPLAGMFTNGTFSGPITNDQGGIASSLPFAMAQRFVSIGVTYKAHTITITDDASAAGSLFVDYINSTSMFRVGKQGDVVAAGTLTVGGTTSLTGTTINMVTSGTTLTVGVGADNGTVSAGIFTDRTKHFEGDALAEIVKIKGKNGEIDHDSLPAFARAEVKRPIMEGKEQVGEETTIERDLGATISMLLVAVQQLNARLTAAGL